MSLGLAQVQNLVTTESSSKIISIKLRTRVSTITLSHEMQIEYQFGV